MTGSRSVPARSRATLRVALASVAFGTFAFAATASHAALFDDDEARRQIQNTNARLNTIQKQIEDRLAVMEAQLKSQGLVDLLNAMEQVRGDLARLRGQIEVNSYELEQQQKRQRDLYVDLDARLRKIETAQAAAAAPADPNAAAASGATTNTTGAPPTTASPGFGPPPPTSGGAIGSTVTPPTTANAAPSAAARPAASPDPVAEQRAYDAALDQFKRGDYGGAINGFNAFVRNYPRSPLASSAQYWIGNAQYARRDYRASIAAQRQLVQSYPDSTKVPDALLNIASAQADMGDSASARRTLEDLMSRYPQTEAAQKARQRLGVR